MASSRRRATLSISSRRTTAKVEAVNPCLREFWAARTLPSGERGPVERATLARLAASFLSETGFLARVIGRSVLSYSMRSEEHTSELQSLRHLVCRLLLE